MPSTHPAVNIRPSITDEISDDILSEIVSEFGSPSDVGSHGLTPKASKQSWGYMTPKGSKQSFTSDCSGSYVDQLSAMAMTPPVEKPSRSKARGARKISLKIFSKFF